MFQLFLTLNGFVCHGRLGRNVGGIVLPSGHCREGERQSIIISIKRAHFIVEWNCK